MRCLVYMSLAAATLAFPAAALADTWQWPVEGPLAERFAYRESMPFSRGQHRGIDIAASAGTVVRSACHGRVRFAGSVAGSEGIVSVTCGGLAASYLHLGSISVRAGAEIGAGEQIGSVGRRSRLYLSARRAQDRFGYVDPLSLLRETGPPIPPVPRFSARRPPVTAPLGPAPRPVPVWHRSPVPATEPGRVPVAEPRHVPAAHPHPSGQPLVVWAGLGLLAAALPSWGVRRVRRQRQRLVQAGLRAG